MRLQMEYEEVTEVLRTYTEALERAARAEAALHEEQRRNDRLSEEIRGLNQRIDGITRQVNSNENPAMRDHLWKVLTRVCGALARNEKILAIKLVREYTACGLKEAKDLVEGTTDRVSGF